MWNPMFHFQLFTCRLHRRVSFADAVGLDLTSIRIMTEGRDTPPYLESCFEFEELSISKQPEPVLTALFSQPVSNYTDFLKQLTHNAVSLESIDATQKALTGMIKVSNLGYQKSVIIRYTTDGWKSHEELTCYYVNPVYSSGTQSVHDTFAFQIEVDKTWTSFEFCICYSCAGSVFWDNNYGQNYKLSKK